MSNEKIEYVAYSHAEHLTQVSLEHTVEQAIASFDGKTVRQLMTFVQCKDYLADTIRHTLHYPFDEKNIYGVNLDVVKNQDGWDKPLGILMRIPSINAMGFSHRLPHRIGEIERSLGWRDETGLCSIKYVSSTAPWLMFLDCHENWFKYPWAISMLALINRAYIHGNAPINTLLGSLSCIGAHDGPTMHKILSVGGVERILRVSYEEADKIEIHNWWPKCTVSTFHGGHGIHSFLTPNYTIPGCDKPMFPFYQRFSKTAAECHAHILEKLSED